VSDLNADLRDGTLVRHKSMGYEGKIEGTTSIKACFTRDGAALSMPTTKESFQYRISIAGESLRRVAPLEDLEIIAAVVLIECVACRQRFRTKPGLPGKPCGRCVCGGWICPLCMTCQQPEEAAKNSATACLYQKNRHSRKRANANRARVHHPVLR
jgi:hypothetical protein